MGVESSTVKGPADFSIVDLLAPSSAAEQPSEASRPVRQAISRIDKSIQQRIHRGINYNLKIVIRGKRNVGKTMLFRRLKGLAFLPQYQKTKEIQTATINWSYNADGDDAPDLESVKVEVWDVVDEGFMPSGPTPEMIEEQIRRGAISGGTFRIGALDASMVDVYQDASAVIFMVNPLDAESVTYVREAYIKVPYDVPILILGNFRDKLSPDSQQQQPSPPTQPSNRTNVGEKAQEGSKASSSISEESSMSLLLKSLVDDISAYRRELRTKICFEPWTVDASAAASQDLSLANRTAPPLGKAGNSIFHTYYSLPSVVTEDVHAIEVSMQNCYGLNELYKYINLPFLRQKQRVLEEQLVRGRQKLLDTEAQLLSALSASRYEEYVGKYDQIQRERRQARDNQGVKAPIAAAGASIAEVQRLATRHKEEDMSATLEDSGSDSDDNRRKSAIPAVSSVTKAGIAASTAGAGAAVSEAVPAHDRQQRQPVSATMQAAAVLKKDSAEIVSSVQRPEHVDHEDSDEDVIIKSVALNRTRRKVNPSVKAASTAAPASTTSDSSTLATVEDDAASAAASTSLVIEPVVAATPISAAVLQKESGTTATISSFEPSTVGLEGFLGQHSDDEKFSARTSAVAGGAEKKTSKPKKSNGSKADEPMKRVDSDEDEPVKLMSAGRLRAKPRKAAATPAAAASAATAVTVVSAEAKSTDVSTSASNPVSVAVETAALPTIAANVPVGDEDKRVDTVAAVAVAIATRSSDQADATAVETIALEEQSSSTGSIEGADIEASVSVEDAVDTVIVTEEATENSVNVTSALLVEVTAKEREKGVSSIQDQANAAADVDADANADNDQIDTQNELSAPLELQELISVQKAVESDTRELNYVETITSGQEDDIPAASRQPIAAAHEDVDPAALLPTETETVDSTVASVEIEAEIETKVVDIESNDKNSDEIEPDTTIHSRTEDTFQTKREEDEENDDEDDDTIQAASYSSQLPPLSSADSLDDDLDNYDLADDSSSGLGSSYNSVPLVSPLQTTKIFRTLSSDEVSGLGNGASASASIVAVPSVATPPVELSQLSVVPVASKVPEGPAAIVIAPVAAKTQPRRKRAVVSKKPVVSDSSDDEGGVSRRSTAIVDDDDEDDDKYTKSTPPPLAAATLRKTGSAAAAVTSTSAVKAATSSVEGDGGLAGIASSVKVGDDLDDSFFDDGDDGSSSNSSSSAVVRRPAATVPVAAAEGAASVVHTRTKIEEKDIYEDDEDDEASAARSSLLASKQSRSGARSTTTAAASATSSALSQEAQLAIQAAMKSWTATTTAAEDDSGEISGSHRSASKASSKSKDKDSSSSSKRKKKIKLRPVVTADYDYDSETDL